MKYEEENGTAELELSYPEHSQAVLIEEGASGGRISEKKGKVESGYKRSDLKLNDSIDFSKELTSKQVKGGRDINPQVIMPSSTDSQEKLLAIILKTNQTKLYSKADSSS